MAETRYIWYVNRCRQSESAPVYQHGKKGSVFTYHMDCGVLKLVLLFVVKDEAVLLDEADDGRLPSWTLQECDKAVENPVLKASKTQSISLFLEVCVHFWQTSENWRRDYLHVRLRRAG